MTKVAFLGRCAGLQRAPEGVLARVAELIAPRDLDRREILWRDGDPADGVAWVRSGVLREALGGVTLGFRGRGALVGDAEPARGATVSAHEPAVVYLLAAAELARLLSEPSIGAGLAAAWAARARRAEERLALALHGSAEARLAAALLDLSRDFGVRDDRGVIIDLRLTHREIAALVGATRETVTTALLAWRGDGVVAVEGKRVVVLDPVHLAERARPPR